MAETPITVKTDFFGCLGCAIWLIGAILFVFVATHVSQIWAHLERAVH